MPGPTAFHAGCRRTWASARHKGAGSIAARNRQRPSRGGSGESDGSGRKRVGSKRRSGPAGRASHQIGGGQQNAPRQKGGGRQHRNSACTGQDLARRHFPGVRAGLIMRARLAAVMDSRPSRVRRHRHGARAGRHRRCHGNDEGDQHIGEPSEHGTKLVLTRIRHKQPSRAEVSALASRSMRCAELPRLCSRRSQSCEKVDRIASGHLRTLSVHRRRLRPPIGTGVPLKSQALVAG